MATTPAFSCPDCGKTFYNRWAHYEECNPGPGVSARNICRQIVTSLPVTRCVLDEGHTGPCKGRRGA